VLQGFLDQFTVSEQPFTFLDFGCSHGTLCALLATLMPNGTRVMGIEIETTVACHFSLLVSRFHRQFSSDEAPATLELYVGDALQRPDLLQQAHVVSVCDIAIPDLVLYGNI